MRWCASASMSSSTRTGVQIFHRGERAASHARVAGQNHWATLGEHMPPGHSAVAKRTPDWVRDQAAKVGVATAAYVERLLTGRDHIEQGVRVLPRAFCAWATRYPGEQLEAACVRALSAGASSSGFRRAPARRAGGHSSTPWPRMASAITATFAAPADYHRRSAPPIRATRTQDATADH